MNENESAVDEQIATQAASGSAFGSAADVEAPLVMRLRFEPTAVRCPHCARWVATQVTLRYGLYAWLSLGLLLLATLMCVLSLYYFVFVSRTLIARTYQFSLPPLTEYCTGVYV